MRLIDADALEWFQVTLSNGETCILIRKSHINELPTVDAEPVRHRRWIKKRTTLKYISHYECSACGSWQGMYWMNYCPNCGAKMDGGKQDANV